MKHRTSRTRSKTPKPPRRRNPVARALRATRPKVVPKATAYSRKRLPKPGTDDA